MADYKYDVYLYRMGEAGGPETRYFIKMEGISVENEKPPNLEFVRPYRGITVEQLNQINDEVLKYKGPQAGLLGIIKCFMETEWQTTEN